jgi:hypothetical protein
MDELMLGICMDDVKGIFGRGGGRGAVGFARGSLKHRTAE